MSRVKMHAFFRFLILVQISCLLVTPQVSAVSASEDVTSPPPSSPPERDRCGCCEQEDVGHQSTACCNTTDPDQFCFCESGGLPCGTIRCGDTVVGFGELLLTVLSLNGVFWGIFACTMKWCICQKDPEKEKELAKLKELEGKGKVIKTEKYYDEDNKKWVKREVVLDEDETHSHRHGLYDEHHKPGTTCFCISDDCGCCGLVAAFTGIAMLIMVVATAVFLFQHRHEFKQAIPKKKIHQYLAYADGKRNFEKYDKNYKPEGLFAKSMAIFLNSNESMKDEIRQRRGYGFGTSRSGSDFDIDDSNILGIVDKNKNIYSESGNPIDPVSTLSLSASAARSKGDLLRSSSQERLLINGASTDTHASGTSSPSNLNIQPGGRVINSASEQNVQVLMDSEGNNFLADSDGNLLLNESGNPIKCDENGKIEEEAKLGNEFVKSLVLKIAGKVLASVIVSLALVMFSWHQEKSKRVNEESTRRAHRAQRMG